MKRFFLAAVLCLPIAGSAVAAPPQKDVGEKSADPGSKMICKKFLETGSLVKGYRVCKTKTEWQRDRDLIRQSTATTSCQNAAMGNPCG
ncbi:MAG: hypothetical protein V4595_14535 [Pseudomonadota bacterium]|jgi:hypothetical protein